MIVNMRLRAMLYVKNFEGKKGFYGQMLRASTSNTNWTDGWGTFETGGAYFSYMPFPLKSRRTFRLNRRRSHAKSTPSSSFLKLRTWNWSVNDWKLSEFKFCGVL